MSPEFVKDGAIIHWWGISDVVMNVALFLMGTVYPAILSFPYFVAWIALFCRWSTTMHSKLFSWQSRNSRVGFLLAYLYSLALAPGNYVYQFSSIPMIPEVGLVKVALPVTGENAYVVLYLMFLAIVCQSHNGLALLVVELLDALKDLRRLVVVLPARVLSQRLYTNTLKTPTPCDVLDDFTTL